MKKVVFNILGTVLLITLYPGCQKPKSYSDIPYIQFVSLAKQQSVISRLDSTTVLTISFTDGDGDIGYLPNGQNGYPLDDTTSIYYVDFVVSFYQKINGQWMLDTNNYTYGRSPFSERLPYLTPSGDNKTLSGDISLTQYIYLYPVSNDTIHYQVYIYDRALHKSNVITTPDIVISTN